MASTTATVVPIHDANLDLVEELRKNIRRNPNIKSEDILSYPSIYAPMDNMTYTNHVMYSVLGHSASGVPLTMDDESASTGKLIASNGVALQVIDLEGSYGIIGTKRNGTRKPLPTDTSLAYGIPPFPIVQLSPKTLHIIHWWDADTKVFNFPACSSEAMAQMFDFQLEGEQTQLLIHPTEVIYRTRELFRKPIKSDDTTTQAAILAELHDLYNCAVAMTMALLDENDEVQDSRTNHFREGMRQNYISVTSPDKDAIKGIAPRPKVKRDAAAPDGKGIETELWFFRELLTEWALMTVHLLHAARKQLGKGDVGMSW